MAIYSNRNLFSDLREKTRVNVIQEQKSDGDLEDWQTGHNNILPNLEGWNILILG